MAIHTAQANLRDVLAGLYPDESSARRVVADSGLDERRIGFSSRSTDNWHVILTEAEKVGKVEAVIDIAVHEYSGNNKLLRAALDWYRALSRNSNVSTAVPVVDMPIDFDWVTIPAGNFLMGSNKQHDSMADDNELPQHTVYLPEFRISRVPVTNIQYAYFVEATQHEPPLSWRGGEIPAGKENHPVVRVSWHDAQAFCQWAGVRLPTEAEWEKAARGTDGRVYPWGDDLPNNSLCNFGGKVGGTTLVGSYPKGASPYGVLDMSGNVWEWTSSLAWDYPYNASDGRESSQIRTDRALRGGSWKYHDVDAVRCALRNTYNPSIAGGSSGIRVVVRLSPGSS